MFLVLLFLCFSKRAGAQLAADFSASVTEGCPSLTVNFTDLSAGSPASWFWNFGNGNTSTQQNPTAVYDSSGSYTITLIISGAGGTDTAIKYNYIIVDTPPKALAQVFPLEGCVPLTIDFKDSSNAGSGTITNWLWDFGDGNTSPRPNPTNTYNAQGTYTVTLYVENSKGCKDIAVLTKNLTVGSPPAVDFSYNIPADTICASVPVKFKNLTTGGVTSWRWDFGDEDTSTRYSPVHVFQDTGYMTVTLVAFNNGCSVSVTKDSIVYTLPPVVKIGYGFSCDSPLVRSFKAKYLGAYNINWTFGDGLSSTDSLPVHTYTSPGTYFVKLYADNPNTCTYNDSLLVTVIDEHPSFTYTALHSNFCKRDTIQFTAANYNAVNMASFAWQYGDSSVASAFSNSSTSTHVYTSAGTYYPALYARDILGCTDTISSPAL
ncbi:MAG TPA: PKD domain-containing protein, partial [Chitinophagaceae bacterium]|nr:PKD domain-containing protein [Chitinophagaceae bacterium]